MYQHSNNSRLPIELLGNIFRRFIEEDENDSVAYEPDDLLLVCKIWRDAALCFTDLWSNLDICLDRNKGHDELYWLRYTTTRIKRAGPLQLLDIQFRSRYPHSWAYTYTPGHQGHSHFQKLLLALTGLDGETAAQWRSFYFFIIESGTEIASRLFSFPMPALQKLDISFIILSSLFPHVPALTDLTLSNCHPTCLPHISNVESLSLHAGVQQSSIDLTPLSGAVSLTRLTLNCWLNFTFPPNCRLKSLVEFNFTGCMSAQTLEHFIAPNLRHLTLLVDSGVCYIHVAQAHGIPLDLLESFRFGWPYRIEDVTIQEYLAAAQTLLKKLPQLQKMSFENKFIAELALKMLVDADANLFPTPPGEGHLDLGLDGVSSPIGYGTRRRQSVDEFRRLADINPEESWEDLYTKFRTALEF